MVRTQTSLPRNRRLAVVALSFAFALAACDAEQSPVGPAGPQGLPGAEGLAVPPGPDAAAQSASGTVGSEGVVEAFFPGFSLETTVVTCWTSDDGSAWQRIAPTSADITCGVYQDGQGLSVVLAGGPPGLQYLITAEPTRTCLDQSSAGECDPETPEEVRSGGA